jgi:two-component system, OmpR family, phosphate regulon sensor histidine kinase PhoR
MRYSSPRRLAILLSAIISIIAIGMAVFINVFNIRTYILLSAFIAFIVFFVIYFIVNFSLNKFIYERIKPIYKTIYSAGSPDEKLKADITKPDVIETVKQDALHWAKSKTSEISQLRQLERYRREFLGNVSHELKTPIFNIQGYILTLLDGGLDDPSINKHYLERAEKSVNRLISIVNDLESISRLESGELKLDIKRFNIVKLVTEVFEENEMLARESKIKLKFANNYEKPIVVKADRKRILEVMNNLVVNSIKYGKEKGTTIVDFLDMGENILIEVKDDGVGISDKDLPRIFERFYRTDKSRSRDMGGTGLGLSIVKHIIEAHNQTINVHSKVERGSSFAFTLNKG